MVVRRMAKSNPHIRLWIDVKIGRFWYVFMWKRGATPHLYRSLDGTPPRGASVSAETGEARPSNRGRMLFGNYSE